MGKSFANLLAVAAILSTAVITSLVFSTATGGSLTVSGTTTTTVLCLGADCRTVWPTSGAGSLQTVMNADPKTTSTGQFFGGSTFGGALISTGTAVTDQLTWISASGTNTTSTNLFFNNATGTFVVAASSSHSNINFQNATGARFIFTNATGSNLTVASSSHSNINFQNATGSKLIIGSVFGAITNNLIDVGSSTVSFRNVYASGTGFFATDVKVGVQSVCLANGTNCPSSYTSLSIGTLTVTTSIELGQGIPINVNGTSTREQMYLSGCSGYGDNSTGTAPSRILTAPTGSGFDTCVTPFDASTTQYHIWQTVLPGAYATGTPLQVSYEWMSTSSESGTVSWNLQCTAFADGNSIAGAWGTTSTLWDTNGGAYTENFATTTNMLPGGTPTPGKSMMCRAWIDTAGTLGSNALLKMVNLKYLKGTHTN